MRDFPLKAPPRLVKALLSVTWGHCPAVASKAAFSRMLNGPTVGDIIVQTFWDIYPFDDVG
jgi:hypothetical protein